MPTLELEIDIAFIQKLVDNLTRRDNEPGRRARKGWGTFTVVTIRQAVAVLIAQHFRCAVTANELSFARLQLNTMRCAHIVLSVSL